MNTMTSIRSSLCTLGLVPLLGVLVAPGQAQAAPDEPVSATPEEPTSAARSRGASLVMLPTLAAAIGPSWSLQPAAERTLVVDVTVGAVLGWPRGRADRPGLPAAPLQNEERYLRATPWLQPELGYSYQHGADSRPQRRGHLASLGLGLGYGSLFFAAVSYTPRLVVGALGDELAVGLRHGLAGHFLGRLFVLELSHQMLWTGGEPSHVIRLTLGLNAGALLLGWL